MWRVPRLRLEPGLFRRRGAALLLALALEALLVLLLLYLIPPVPGGRKPGATTTFTIDAGSDKDQEAAAEADKAKPAERTAVRPPTPRPPVVPPPLVPIPPQPNGPLPFIVMSRDEYRAAQIVNMPSRPSEPGAPAAAAAGGSGRSDDTPVVGKGPNGEPLYRAEWYRRPRQVELDAYLPRRWAREGSGLIACRTIARYHVDDCRILGETPPGSGYGNAVLQAAFQFLVRPPRVGGKELVGSWVSIRIDYTVTVK